MKLIGGEKVDKVEALDMVARPRLTKAVWVTERFRGEGSKVVEGVTRSQIVIEKVPGYIKRHVLTYNKKLFLSQHP